MHKNKKIFQIFIIAIIVGATLLAALYFLLDDRSNTSGSTPQTDRARILEEEAKADVNPKTDNEAAYRAEQEKELAKKAAATQQVKVTISSVAQDDNFVFIGATADGQRAGSCTLKLTNASKSVQPPASQMQLVTSYYACQVRVEKSQLSQGLWKGVMAFKNGDATGTSSEVEVKID